MSTVYFNEFDKFAAQWLRNLYPDAHVDERDIRDVKAEDVAGFERVHYFGGIGGWQLALDLAGWSGPVWTGSCPCQPLSCAGKRAGEKDERHLWPEFYRLISECRPATIFGEQVASKDGLEWLDGISLDLEELDYAVAASDLPAASVGSPMRRQRFWWGAIKLGNTDSARCWRGRSVERQQVCEMPTARVDVVPVANTESERRNRIAGSTTTRRNEAWGGCGISRMANSNDWNSSDGEKQRSGKYGFWTENTTVVLCSDGKRRKVPIEPKFQPLAHGVPRRVGRLRAFGNAIVPQLAAVFIRSFMEANHY